MPRSMRAKSCDQYDLAFLAFGPNVWVIWVDGFHNKIENSFEPILNTEQSNP